MKHFENAVTRDCFDPTDQLEEAYRECVVIFAILP